MKHKADVETNTAEREGKKPKMIQKTCFELGDHQKHTNYDG